MYKVEHIDIMMSNPCTVVAEFIEQGKLGGNIQWKKISPKDCGAYKQDHWTKKAHPEPWCNV